MEKETAALSHKADTHIESFVFVITAGPQWKIRQREQDLAQIRSGGSTESSQSVTHCHKPLRRK